MSADVSVFDGRLAEWAQYQQTPWGRLRYAVVAHTLDTVVGAARGLRVLDVGGGDGRDAVHLAGRGHDVTVLDPSADLLAKAPPPLVLQGATVG